MRLVCFAVKETTEKPNIKDFKLGCQLGEGNFSRIMLATHNATNEVFALKVIEKQRIKRLRVRHGNIFNEINMEKEVLNKLRHPNIVRLYHTFQDNENLYFLLEYIEGGELLNYLVHEGKQIGINEDAARFYLADIVNALEFMHANQIIHRDVKPENMVVCATDGHIRLIDFGTAKDLADATLNGPNFVGTPEYMSPETVDNKDVTYAADIWALGCLAYQLLCGETPFGGGSAYLTFLKVKEAEYNLPEFLSDSAKNLIDKLLQRDPSLRPSISDIKAHPFFLGIDFVSHLTAQPPVNLSHDPALLDLIRELGQAEKLRSPIEPLDFTSDAVQPQIMKLDAKTKCMVMHLLQRKQLLHLPGIYPRFFDTPNAGRCMYAVNKGFIGYTHEMQNQWNENFEFIVMSGPCLGRKAAEKEADGRGGSSWSDEEQLFSRAISIINSRKPAFVVICGNFVRAKCEEHFREAQLCSFKELINKVNCEIKLVFVPGCESIPESSNDHNANFGDDYFSFWYGGIKGIVINSSTIAHEGQLQEKAKAQEDWLVKELDNAKICARETVVFSAHTFHSAVQGPELPPHLVAKTNQAEASSEDGDLSVSQKKRYADIINRYPPRLFVTQQGNSDRVTTILTSTNPNSSGEEDEVKKTEQVVCSSPFTPISCLHVASVTQTGISVTQIKLDDAATISTKAHVPEIAEENALKSDSIRVEVTTSE
ncbi:hypothetical protein Poli38472_006232 [Pythium oligandrum]|uniref:Protein kinase domain-containing protein n=1 Tax=Pythium oligandrum TaxID=41045 RepID=A0A8K1CT49_PYTOL|nr:hypothetical protein Poli38472_006232 [Pythium oligandrum]|eukprot:TMW68764.1 hypothetical protein Poli38472_006232 [Pythium oligandrum]